MNTKTKQMKLKEKINALKPSERIVISEIDGTQVIAERSGDGKKLLFVRENKKGFEVISTQSF